MRPGEQWQKALPGSGGLSYGYTPGQLTLRWAVDQKYTDLHRAEIIDVEHGAGHLQGTEMKPFEDQSFCLTTRPHGKVFVFACKDKAEKEQWYSAVKSALEKLRRDKKRMNSSVKIVEEFKTRPLGFRVGEQFVQSPAGKTIEVLVVARIHDASAHLRKKGLVEGMVITASEDSEGRTDFASMKYSEKVEVIKNNKEPFRLTFEGRQYLYETSKASPHPKDLSMEVLYPELFQALTTEGTEQREALYNHNQELREWLDRPDFKELLRELMSNPRKLRAFLMDKEL